MSGYHDILREIANWLLLTITLGYWVFALVYGGIFKWYNNEVGRVQFPSKLLMALILTQVTASAFTMSGYPFRDEVRLMLYFFGALIVVVVDFVLVRMAISKIRIKRAIKRGDIVCPKDLAKVNGTTPHEL